MEERSTTEEDINKISSSAVHPKITQAQCKLLVFSMSC